MRDKINEIFETIKCFEPYDWFIVLLMTILLLILPKILNTVYELIMRYVFKMERCKWIKGWKNIENK